MIPRRAVVDFRRNAAVTPTCRPRSLFCFKDRANPRWYDDIGTGDRSLDTVNVQIGTSSLLWP